MIKTYLLLFSLLQYFYFIYNSPTALPGQEENENTLWMFESNMPYKKEKLLTFLNDGHSNTPFTVKEKSKMINTETTPIDSINFIKIKTLNDIFNTSTNTESISNIFIPPINSSFIINQKLEFLKKMLKTFSVSKFNTHNTTAKSLIDGNNNNNILQSTEKEIKNEESTIVPPDFWLPDFTVNKGISYTNKVVEFLNKLFHFSNSTSGTNLKFTRTVLIDNEVKNNLINTIMQELITIKNDLIAIITDMKESYSSTSKNKRIKPLFHPQSGIGPLEEKVSSLEKIFNVLINLEKNTSPLDVSHVVKPNMGRNSNTFNKPTSDVNYLFTRSMNNFEQLPYVPHIIPLYYSEVPTINPNFNFLPLKGGLGEINSARPLFERNINKLAKKIRNVKIGMHQGYQSMPPGTIETVQAGTGSTGSHEGGGIKLNVLLPI